MTIWVLEGTREIEQKQKHQKATSHKIREKRKATFRKSTRGEMMPLKVSIHPDPPNLVLFSNPIQIIGNGWKNPKSKKGCVEFSRWPRSIDLLTPDLTIHGFVLKTHPDDTPVFPGSFARVPCEYTEGIRPSLRENKADIMEY